MPPKYARSEDLIQFEDTGTKALLNQYSYVQ